MAIEKVVIGYTGEVFRLPVIALVTLAFLVPASARADTPPPDVASALAGFPTDPAAAMAAWTGWAAMTPMTSRTTTSAPKGRVTCRIDAARVSRCLYAAEVIGRGGRNMGIRPISDVVTTPSGRQYFRDPPIKKWTSNKFGANENPITNTSRFYSYNPWQPWLTPGIRYTTSVDARGWFTITSSNPSPRDDEPPTIVTSVAPDGGKASLIQQNAKGRALERTRIDFTSVPPIQVPPRR